MEDNLKILKVEYLSNHLLDHTQILNLKSLTWRRPPMEDNLNCKDDLQCVQNVTITNEFLGRN